MIMPAPQGPPQSQGVPQGLPSPMLGAMPPQSAQQPVAGTQGPPAPPPVTIDAVMRLLRDDKMRSFKIDVETDSLVEANQNAEKGKRIEFVTAVGKYMESMGPLVREMPALAPMIGSMLQFAVRGFKVGSELEDTIEKAITQAGLEVQAPKPAPQPSPDEQMKLQGIQAKTQAEIQKAKIGVQQAQADAQGKAMVAQLEARLAVMEHQMRAQELMMKASHAQAAAGNQIASSIADHALATDNLQPPQAAPNQQGLI